MKRKLGEVSVLNTLHGDLKLSFDSDDPMEVERARLAVEDMLRRGYILFAHIDGKLEKIVAFDAATNEYLIAAGPVGARDGHGGSPEAKTSPATETQGQGPVEEVAPAVRRRGRPRKHPAKTTTVTAVAPTSGG